MMENTKNDAISSMTDDRQPIKLEDLPMLPLSKISSFLTLTDQRNFERTNQSIFIQLAVGYFDLEDCDWPRKLNMEHLISFKQKFESLDTRFYRSFITMLDRKFTTLLIKGLYQQLIDDQSQSGIDEMHRILDLVLRAEQAQEIDLESNGQEQKERAPISDELESLHLRNLDIIHGVDGNEILENVKELNVCICGEGFFPN